MRRALLVCVALAATAVAHAGTREPQPLSGVPLGDTGLRLLVSDDPPFVLDIDSGALTRVAIPRLRHGVVWVEPLGGRAGIVFADSFRDAKVYLVRGDARVTSLGSARDVAADAARGVWIKTARGSRCFLRRVSLDGRALGSARAFPCASTIAPGGRLGVVVNRTRLVDARGRTVRRTRWGIIAATGTTLVVYGGRRRLATVDARTGTERRLAWPSILDGLDTPAVDPTGRYVALGFATPAWQGTGIQVTDVWLLDTRTAKLTHVPGTPATVSLKRSSMQWTGDGRLVWLAESGRDVVAVWRPGEPRLSLKTVRLPADRAGSSDAFAILG